MQSVRSAPSAPSGSQWSLASGVLECVPWNDRMPILLQPCAAVPEGTVSFYQPITDARFANRLYSDRGGHVYDGGSAQQHPRSMRLPLLDRHLGRVPPLVVGRLRRRTPTDQAPRHRLARTRSAQRGDMDCRPGHRMRPVHVPRGLRQGPERHHDTRLRIPVRSSLIRPDDGR